jgi:DNA-binding beta-propeller fold protein YncE
MTSLLRQTIHFFITLTILFISWACSPTQTSNQAKGKDPLLEHLIAQSITLPNGWSLTPIGKSLPLNDLPLNLIVSPSKKLMAVTNNGQSTQSITLIEVAGEKILDDITIKKSWVGLAFSQDEKYLYASGGNDNIVVIYKIENQKLIPDGEIKLGEVFPKSKISPAGLCVDSPNNRLYVVAKDSKSLFICDLKNRHVIKEEKLSAEPYTCMIAPQSHELYITLWGGAKVVVYDILTEKLTHEIATNSNPNDMVFTKDGRYLFVPNGNDNTVSAIETSSHSLIEHISAALYPNAPIGSTPNGVALSPDENSLYIANADNNCLAVFDISQKGKSVSKGFIPTGWYPTSVKTIDHKIYVTNGKGFSSKPNPKGPNPMAKKKPQEVGANPEANKEVVEYIAGLFKGTLSIIDVPNEQTLSTYSQVVFQNTPYNKQKENMAMGESDNPIPMKVGGKSPIKYVFYIIKENRTYDQVLGDIKEGNGDPELCIFPERLTPNQHKLVRDFVLLDNFYVDAEVSADGHNWSTAAYANDYVEKNWVTSYGGRGGSYDFEGQRAIAYPKNGFIWDYCKRANIPFRTYGEFADNPEGNYEGVKGNVCRNYKGWDMNFKDSDREKQWEIDFDSLLARNAVPHFSSLRMGNDHTSGSRKGAFSVEAAIADNDLAVGQFIEHLSKSKIWHESAVFIVEDDAQNGSDHVDAHRSTAYVISPYTKRNFVDHTMYSTAGILRTMELILGIPPMSQYDAAAMPLFKCFSKKIQLTPFQAVPENVDINQRNIALNNSKRTANFDFSHEDSAPDLAFNEDIWKVMKGEKSKMPAPKRSAFVKIPTNIEKEDDDD